MQSISISYPEDTECLVSPSARRVSLMPSLGGIYEGKITQGKSHLFLLIIYNHLFCWGQKIEAQCRKGQQALRDLNSHGISDMEGISAQARKDEGTTQIKAYQHLNSFCCFPSTYEKDKTNNTSKSPEVNPSDRPTSSHSEGSHRCPSGQANTAGKGSPVIPKQQGHIVLSRARPIEKPGYTQRNVKHYLFCNYDTILHHPPY